MPPQSPDQQPQLSLLEQPSFFRPLTDAEINALGIQESTDIANATTANDRLVIIETKINNYNRAFDRIDRNGHLGQLYYQYMLALTTLRQEILSISEAVSTTDVMSPAENVFTIPGKSGYLPREAKRERAKQGKETARSRRGKPPKPTGQTRPGSFNIS